MTICRFCRREIVLEEIIRGYDKTTAGELWATVTGPTTVCEVRPYDDPSDYHVPVPDLPPDMTPDNVRSWLET